MVEGGDGEDGVVEARRVRWWWWCVRERERGGEREKEREREGERVCERVREYACVWMDGFQGFRSGPRAAGGEVSTGEL